MKASDLKFFENKAVAVQLKNMHMAVLPKRQPGEGQQDPVVDEVELEDGSKMEFGHPAMVFNNGQPAAMPVLSGYIGPVPGSESAAVVEFEALDGKTQVQVVVSLDEIACVSVIPEPPKPQKIVS